MLARFSCPLPGSCCGTAGKYSCGSAAETGRPRFTPWSCVASAEKSASLGRPLASSVYCCRFSRRESTFAPSSPDWAPACWTKDRKVPCRCGVAAWAGISNATFICYRRRFYAGCVRAAHREASDVVGGMRFSGCGMFLPGVCSDLSLPIHESRGLTTFIIGCVAG